MFFMPIGSYLIERDWDPRLLIFCGGIVGIPVFYLASLMKTFASFAVCYIFAFAWN